MFDAARIVSRYIVQFMVRVADATRSWHALHGFIDQANARVTCVFI
jgi:hypothetical protein